MVGQPGHGATTLALALLAAASAAGSWCAAVGLPDPGVVAAAGLGLDLRRVVFVPHPGSGWAEAAGDLLSGVDAVLVRPPGRARLTAARHLTARARERQAALVVLLEGAGCWPEGGDLALSVGAVEWEGIGQGHGHLRGRRAEVRVSGRRAAGRVTECSLWLPAGSGAVAVAEDGSGPRTWRCEPGDGRRRPAPATGRRRPERSGGEEEVERLVVIWCPELLEEGAKGEEARRFARVLARAGELCPWVHPVRLGVGALPARGPARFFGGEEAVVSRLAGTVGEEAEATIGVADGLFAAVLAARAGLIVPPGGRRTSSPPGRWPRWRGPTWPSPCSGWGSPPWGSSPPCPRRTSRTASGRTRPPATRWPGARAGSWPGCATAAIERRLRVARGEDPDRGATPRPRPPSPASSAARRRPTPGPPAPSSGCRSASGIEAVLMGRLRGGRDPAGQSVLVPWGSPETDARRRPARRGRGGCRRPRRATCCASRSAPRWPTRPAAPSR